MSGRFEFPWEQEARRGERVPEGLSLADMSAYTALRNIYGAYQGKRLDREQAAYEKDLLRREWCRAKDAESFERRLNGWHVRLRRAIERAACDCRKEPTAENALRLCDVVDGLEEVEV